MNALENYGVLFNDWLKKTGEVPAVLDSTEIKTKKKTVGTASAWIVNQRNVKIG